jgi:hypothetical protein
MPSSSESLYAFDLDLAFLYLQWGYLATKGSSVPPEIPPGKRGFRRTPPGPSGNANSKKSNSSVDCERQRMFTIKKLAEREELGEASENNRLGRQPRPKTLNDFIGLFPGLANRAAPLTVDVGGRS